MTNEEEITRLRMRVAELEKENEKEKRKIGALEQEIGALSQKNAEMEEDVQVLSRAVRAGEEKLRLSLFLRFGSCSEKYRKLFNIPVQLLGKEEEGSLTEDEKKLLAEAKHAIERSGKKHAGQEKKGSRNRNPESRVRGNGCGRQSFDPSHPRQREEFLLPEKCPNCGTGLVDIDSPDVHEHIDMVRNSLRIIQQAKHKGYCPCCGETHDAGGGRKRDIITASAPRRFIPGGLAGDGLVAASLVDKFFYGLSVTRISKRFRNLGVDLSEQNFANWHLRAGSELKPVAEAIRDFILTQPAVNADESRIQVLDEKERRDTLDSWMWVICSATPGKPAAYFQYDASRSSDVFKGIVGDYAGYLQADCYVGYQTKRQEYLYTLHSAMLTSDGNSSTPRRPAPILRVRPAMSRWTGSSPSSVESTASTIRTAPGGRSKRASASGSSSESASKNRCRCSRSSPPGSGAVMTSIGTTSSSWRG